MAKKYAGLPERCIPEEEREEPFLCDNTHSFEVQISCVRLRWDQDETIPQLTSLDYGEDYMFVRFVHPYFGQIETIPTRLVQARNCTISNSKADITLYIRTDVSHFWRNLKMQPVLVYVCRKGKIFDEFIGIDFLNFGNLQPRHKGEKKNSDSPFPKSEKTIYEFNVPIRVPVPVVTPAFHCGKLQMTVSITDHGTIQADRISLGSDPVTIDCQAYYAQDLKRWYMRQKDRCAAFYRTFLEFRPAEYEMQRRMADLVKEIDPIVSSAEVQRIVQSAEKRTLLNCRRLENTLAECLRNAEDVRDAVTDMDNERGAVTRIFEHLHAVYVDMMERNKFPTNEHFSYDLLSGKEMDQMRRGMLTLKQEIHTGMARLRGYVATEYSHNLETFDKAMAEVNKVQVPPLKSILCGEYYTPAMDEPIVTYGL